MGWPVYPGAHTLTSDLIGEEIMDWNLRARETQERLEQTSAEIRTDALRRCKPQL